MAIPFSNTTITVQRREFAPTADPTDPTAYPNPEWKTIVEGVAAVIAPPTASNNLIAGDRVTYSSSLRSDPCDMQANDQVTDEHDGTIWVVLWAREFDGVGLDHMEAQLRMVTGFAA